MRVRLDGYARALAPLRRRATALGAVSVLLLVVALFFALATSVAIASTAKELDANEAQHTFLIAFLAIATVVTLVPGALAAWRCAVARARLRRLRDFSLLARRQPISSSADVARSLNLSAAEAEGLVHEAARLGVVDASGPGDAMIGVVLNGTYRLDALLGRGAMGTVYAARHTRTGRAYAVKLIRAEGRDAADLRRRLSREAAAAGSIGHPNIAAVHDLDATPDGIDYLVMDLLRGETLEQRLGRQGALPFEIARRVALDVAAALEAAHAEGLLHRDVKPSNIFLRETASAVLLDFGLVKRLEDAGASRLTRPGAAVGTPLYMSPEQARGEPLDVRSDVHALAAVLFEMVAGVPPFADRTVAEVYARLLTEPAPRVGSLARVPPGLDALLDRGLQKRREDRFESARAFADALARVATAPP